MTTSDQPSPAASGEVAGGDDAEGLARALFEADRRAIDPGGGEQFDSFDNPTTYGMQAEDFLASSWLADRDAKVAAAARAEGAREALEKVAAAARAEGAREALEDAADEMWRVFLRLPHTLSPLGEFIQRRVNHLRARAAEVAPRATCAR